MAARKDHTGALQKLIWQHPTPDQLQAAFEGLRPHSVRGVALSAAAQLDFALMIALLAKLRPLSRDEYLHLFGPEGPYGTSMSKIHVLYSIGVIGTKSKKELQLLQRLRNVFAHAAAPMDFNNLPIQLSQVRSW